MFLRTSTCTRFSVVRSNLYPRRRRSVRGTTTWMLRTSGLVGRFPRISKFKIEEQLLNKKRPSFVRVCTSAQGTILATPLVNHDKEGASS